MVKISTNIKNFIETITKGLSYTKTEIDTKLANKANTNHTHDIASLPDETDMLGHMENNFYTALDTKADNTTATTSANGLMSKEDKSKLDGIATEANKTVVDSSLSASSTNPVQNKVVKGALDGKAGTSIATTSANGLMSSTDKNKLDGIAIGATKVTVDTSLSGSSTNPVQNKVVNNALNGKANSSHNHSISNITNLQSALDSKSNTGHDHTSDEIHYAYDQNVSVTTILENKAPKHHTHDDRYYTETEIDEKLNGKADSNHRHNDVSILKQVDNDWVALPVWYMIKNGWCILQWENPIEYLKNNNVSIPTNSWLKLGNVPVPQTGRPVYQQLTTSNAHVRILVTSGGVLQSYRTGNNVWSYGSLVYPTNATS